MNFDDLAAVDSDINRYPYSKSPEVLSPHRIWDDIRAAGTGACSNYATAKLRLLVERGWPISALRLGCVYVEPFDLQDATLGDAWRPARPEERYHALLTVATERGVYVLCNRQPRPFPARNLAGLLYETDLIQEEGGSMEWCEWRGVT